MVEQITGKEGWLNSRPEGAVTVHFERKYHTNIHTLWHLITDPKALDRWSPNFKFQAKLGGEYHLWFEDAPSGPPHIQGNIEAFQAPNLLQLGSIVFRLEATDTGCRLAFSDTLVFRPSMSKLEVALVVLAGWHRYLDLLEQALTDELVEHNIAEPDYSASSFQGRHLVS